MRIVLLYALLLTLFFVALSVRTLRLRRSLSIAIGHDGNPEMLRAMRVHANFAEYVPLGLLLLYFVEATQAKPLGCACARSQHPCGSNGTCLWGQPRRRKLRFRVAGMALTFTALIVMALRVLFVFFGFTAL